MMKICPSCSIPGRCDMLQKCMFTTKYTEGGIVLGSEKPPLGLMPQRVWVQRRVLDILQAMSRYLEADKKIPEEWINELREHNK